MIAYEDFVKLTDEEKERACIELLNAAVSTDYGNYNMIKHPETIKSVQTIIDYIWDYRYDIGYDDGHYDCEVEYGRND